MNVPNIYTLPDISFVGGSTQKLSFNILSKGREPLDMSACTANFSLINYVNRTGKPIVSKEMTISGDSVQNVLQVTLLPSDTVDLFGKFIYQVTIKDAIGVIDIPNQGQMIIVNNINKEYVN